MSRPPLVLFSSRVDPAGVLALLESAGSVDVDVSFLDGEPPTDPRDPAHALLQKIAAHLDAVFFLARRLLDGEGRVLVSADGEVDEGARWPGVVPTRTEGPIEDEDLDEDDDVLGWSLGWWPMPRYDALANPPELWRAVGLPDDPAHARALIAAAELQPEAALDDMSTHLLMLHWRMVDYRVEPRPVDFVKLSKGCWFGTFSLDDFEIAEDDLAIQGQPIHRADPEAVRRTSSAAMERHLAINWINEGGVYSETDTST